MLTNNLGHIYRNFELTRTSKSTAGEMIQGLVNCNASITDMFVLSNGFSDKQVTYKSSFYRLKFRRQEDLDKFHSLGFITNDPPHVHLDQIELGLD